MNEFGVPKFRRLGTNVLVVHADGSRRLENQERIWRLHAAARALDGVCESVPGMNNLTLLYDERIAPDTLERRLREAWDMAVPVGARSRTHVIEVRYGGTDGPDLAGVAAAAQLSEREVVRLHASTEYVVYFLGFQPGFAYLGDLDRRLYLPRRDVPRAVVPAGSVAVALHQTAIYPFASPGGWHIIGRTDATVFDPLRSEALFAAGDRVRFREHA
ncbi:MAG: 5-oxoprolinase subunit PxpB [Candidatus Eremiobacteraeota bacterium]|nr:5-oxoprolinase subunit PxpB [Candidatus Eremiobacteraeota bacterium]